MPVEYGLSLAASRDIDASITELYRRSPTTGVFSPAFRIADAGPGSFPILLTFMVDRTDPTDVTLEETHVAGSGIWHTEDGITWALYDSVGDGGMLVKARDPDTGDCYSPVGPTAETGAGEGGVGKSTDNGVNWTMLIPNMHAAMGYVLGSVIRCLTVAGEYVWLVFWHNAGPVDDRTEVWRIKTDGTLLEQLTYPGGVHQDQNINIHASPTADRVWLFHAGGSADHSRPIWRIDTTTGAITELTGPPRTSDFDSISMVLSTSNTHVLAHVIDHVTSGGGGSHSGLGKVFESTDDGVNWTEVLSYATVLANGINGEFLVTGGTMMQDQQDSTRLALAGDVPTFYESTDSGSTWAAATCTPGFTEAHWSALGFASLTALDAPGIARHARVGTGRVWYTAT